MSQDELARLRDELDELDRHLIGAAARRGEIVRRVAATKAAEGDAGKLFHRERERAVYDRAREAAKHVGLDPKIAHALMQVLIESGHRVQEEALRGVARAGAEQAQRFLIVGGGGRMGRRLGDELTARGHAIDVLEAGDGRERPAAVAAADVVMVAVPMAVAAPVVAEVAPHVRADALLCDINSLKQGVCEAMAACTGEALGLHPMFGPTVHSMRRQKVVVCPVREGPRAGWLRGELGQMGMELIESDPVTHDRMMAVIQVLVHYSTLVMGSALSRSGVSVAESVRYTSPIYRLELSFVGRLFAQDPDLYAEIVMTNPQGEGVRRHFIDAAGAVNEVVTGGDREAFRALFRDIGAYFKDFADEAMHLSDFIIDQMVMQP